MIYSFWFETQRKQGYTNHANTICQLANFVDPVSYQFFLIVIRSMQTLFLEISYGMNNMMYIHYCSTMPSGKLIGKICGWQITAFSARIFQTSYELRLNWTLISTITWWLIETSSSLIKLYSFQKSCLSMQCFCKNSMLLNHTTILASNKAGNGIATWVVQLAIKVL